MAKKFVSTEPMYSMGAAFVEFGEALMDSRTRVAEAAILAQRCGLKFCIELRDADPAPAITETQEDSPDGR